MMIYFVECSGSGVLFFFQRALYRLRRKCMRLLRRQAARTEGRRRVAPWPLLRRPRPLRPAELMPRASRCLWMALTTQLERGALRMAGGMGAGQTHSYQVKTESVLDQ